MKHRILILLLAGLLVAEAQPAASAEDRQVPSVRTYRGEFTDVAPDDWYYDNVKSLYELGLTNGRGDGSYFAPADSISVMELLVMASRLRSAYDCGDSEAGPSRYAAGTGPWYEPYVLYLQHAGAVGTEFADACERDATRAELAHILANTLPASYFTPINGELVEKGFASGKRISDVSRDTPYCEAILSLYEWGILSGTDRTGSFQPDAAISRCEAAAMFTRLALPELRLTLDWPPLYSREGTAMQDLITSDGTFWESPGVSDSEKIDADLRYMLSRGERTITLHYKPGEVNQESARQLMRVFLRSIRSYVEQTYNEISVMYSSASNEVKLTFSCSLYDEEKLEYYRTATMEAAIAVHDQLWADGTITEDMSQYDRAEAYFTWLCAHCRYDFDNDDSSMSHTGYSAFVDGLAVCDGYTAAYNLLLKLEGIECSTISYSSHIWTSAVLDGQLYHIDPTWGYQTTGEVAYQYFGMTEQASMARF